MFEFCNPVTAVGFLPVRQPHEKTILVSLVVIQIIFKTVDRCVNHLLIQPVNRSLIVLMVLAFYYTRCTWLGGVVVTALYLQLKIAGSIPGRSPFQDLHIHVPLPPSSIYVVSMGSKQAHRATH